MGRVVTFESPIGFTVLRDRVARKLGMRSRDGSTYHSECDAVDSGPC